MRYFKMFERKNQIMDLYKENIDYCIWYIIPEKECILIDPNESHFTENNGVGLYFFAENYYEYFKGYGKYIREVFPVECYPWYLCIEPGLAPPPNSDFPCYKSTRIRLGPVMTIREYENNIKLEYPLDYYLEDPLF